MNQKRKNTSSMTGRRGDRLQDISRFHFPEIIDQSNRKLIPMWPENFLRNPWRWLPRQPKEKFPWQKKTSEMMNSNRVSALQYICGAFVLKWCWNRRHLNFISVLIYRFWSPLGFLIGLKFGKIQTLNTRHSEFFLQQHSPTQPKVNFLLMQIWLKSNLSVLGIFKHDAEIYGYI